MRETVWISRVEQIPAIGTRSGTQVDDPIRGANHIQIVLHHSERGALSGQTIQPRQQPLDVLGVQPGGGFVQNQQLSGEPAATQVACELYTLCRAPRERRGRLTQGQIAEPDVGQRLQKPQRGAHLGVLEGRVPRHEIEHLVYRHGVHIGNGQTIRAERHTTLAHVIGKSQPFTHIAADPRRRQVTHPDLHRAHTAALGTRALGAIEGKMRRTQVRCVRETIPKQVRELGIGRGIRSRITSYRTLINEYWRALEADHPITSHGFACMQGSCEHAFDECALSRTRHAGDHVEASDRQRDIDAAQIAKNCAPNRKETLWWFSFLV